MRALLLASCALAACGAEPTPHDDPPPSQTMSPMVLRAVPDGDSAAPDVVVRLVFSVPMHPSAALAFALESDAGPVAGTSAWDASRTVLAFVADLALVPGVHVIHMDAEARSEAGDPLGAPFAHGFEVVPSGGGKP